MANHRTVQIQSYLFILVSVCVLNWPNAWGASPQALQPRQFLQFPDQLTQKGAQQPKLLDEPLPQPSAITPELLTIRATAEALELGQTDPEFGLANLQAVEAASSQKSEMSYFIRLTYRQSSGQVCEAYNWYDFSGNAVACDPCRSRPDGGSSCACIDHACLDGGTMAVRQGGKTFRPAK